CLFFFSSRRRHTRFSRDWSSDVCSSDLAFLANLVDDGEEETEALIEAEAAIQQVRRERQPVDLAPRRPYLRRLQHELIERAQLKIGRASCRGSGQRGGRRGLQTRRRRDP